MLTLYHATTSVCAIKVRIALAEKALPWSGRMLTLRGDQFDPAYTKLNPNAVVPTLVHDDKVVIESSVILCYLDDAFPEPALMPRAPYDRSLVYMTSKLLDEQVHSACATLTFATVNRARMLALSPEALEADIAKIPDERRRNMRRQVAQMGLDAPVSKDALKTYVKLLDRIEAASKRGPFLAGESYSLADIGATPYVWRLDQLRLSRMWDKRPGVAAWYERMRSRPSFDAAVTAVVTAEDRERYAGFQPDPWPKVQAILASS